MYDGGEWHSAKTERQHPPWLRASPQFSGSYSFWVSESRGVVREEWLIFLSLPPSLSSLLPPSPFFLSFFSLFQVPSRNLCCSTLIEWGQGSNLNPKPDFLISRPPAQQLSWNFPSSVFVLNPPPNFMHSYFLIYFFTWVDCVCQSVLRNDAWVV